VFGAVLGVNYKTDNFIHYHVSSIHWPHLWTFLGVNSLSYTVNIF